MTLVNIVSALGNNNSIYPLLVRDCGIENVAKVTMTYNQNVKDSKFIAKQATRERIIDEYGTSAVWLGGIPLMSWISDKCIQASGLKPNVNLKLYNETAAQGITKNIEKFKNIAKEEVADLVKMKESKGLLQSAQAKKFLATTIIPIAVMGFVLPKLNFKYTNKKIKEAQDNNQINEQDKKYLETKSRNISFGNSINPDTYSTLKKNKFVDENVELIYQNNETNKKSYQPTSRKNVSFGGAIDTLANLSTLQKMMILDGGLTVGRVATARNRDEKAEMAFKMAGMCYLNYVAPKSIDNLLNSITKKTFGINTILDPKFLNDDKFVKAVKDNALALPTDLSEKGLLDFVDNNSKSIFTQLAEKSGVIKMLKNGVRDPREYVDTKQLVELKEALVEFSKDAINSGNVEKFAKKALYAKSFNILANVGLSSALLAVVLPKVQFVFRKILTGSNLEPGIKV